ncbi:hypothetical protein D3C78_1799090 [compost metagenome]
MSRRELFDCLNHTGERVRLVILQIDIHCQQIAILVEQLSRRPGDDCIQQSLVTRYLVPGHAAFIHAGRRLFAQSR